MWILLYTIHLDGGPKGDRHERPHRVGRVTAWLYSQASGIPDVDWASKFCLPWKWMPPSEVERFIKWGPFSSPQAWPKQPAIRLHLTFLLQYGIHDPAPLGALSASTNLGLSCHVSGILESEVVPDPCSLLCSPKCILSLLFSLKNKHTGPQPAAWGWQTCFKIWACRTCQHPGSGKQAALGQNSFANQSCFREVGGLYVGPTLPWPSPYENVWVWMKKRKQSTFHARCRRAKTRFYLKITPLS